MKNAIAVMLLAAASCFAGELTVQVKTDKPDAIYKTGEIATITAIALEDGKPVSGKTVTYELNADGGVNKRGKFVSDAAKPFTWQYKFGYPSALRAEFTILGDDGKRIKLKKGYDQVRFAGGRIGAVADPEKLVPATKRPADFDAFWNNTLAKAAAVPLKELERKDITAKQHHSIRNVINIWDIKVSCFGGMPVSGYLGMSKNAKPKSLPAVLLVQGAGVGSAYVYRVHNIAKQGAIALDINAHGIENGLSRDVYNKMYRDKTSKFHNYYGKYYESKEQHVFYAMAIRVVRALEYLRSLPEWNGKDLIIEGASQGGWQAVIGAGLDPKVTLCVAGVPAFSDFDGEFAPVARMPRMHFGAAIRRVKDAKKQQELLKIQSYFDPANFASRIKCPTYMSVGFVDLSCPTTSVYAIYNSLPGNIKKSIQSYPGGVHATSDNKWGHEAINKVIRESRK